MTNRLRVATCIGLALCLAHTVPAPAQAPGVPYNPYTAKPAAPAFNPYTGAGAGRGPNPFTGASGSPPINPYTGKPMTIPDRYNPLTGGPAKGAEPPSAAPAVLARKVPISGKAGPGLDVLDEAILSVMDHHGIPGAALAIAKNGKLVYAKGFGWADLAAGAAVEPFTIFGLASCSKPITALAILALIEQGKLNLDDRAFDILNHITAPRGVRVDPRIATITIRQLLNHSGGWDRSKSGDLMNQSPLIARRLGVPMPLTEDQFLSYLLTVPLDFNPGAQMQYSNNGYIALGRIVEKVSGMSYERFIQENILKPAGVRAVYLNHGAGRYKAGEAHSYVAGAATELPPMDLRLIKAAAGWNASAVDLTRLLTALDGSRGKAALQGTTFQQMLALPPPPLAVQGTARTPAWAGPPRSLEPKGSSVTSTTASYSACARS
ncbi:MAG: serine hydrolase domain-containing protein [Gemmataceae bacterium]